MAHKKAGGSSRNGRDSNPKYLGVKRYGGERVLAVVGRRGGQAVDRVEHLQRGLTGLPPRPRLGHARRRSRGASVSGHGA